MVFEGAKSEKYTFKIGSIVITNNARADITNP